jgi:hypothetical protein
VHNAIGAVQYVTTATVWKTHYGSFKPIFGLLYSYYSTVQYTNFRHQGFQISSPPSGTLDATKKGIDERQDLIRTDPKEPASTVGYSC